MLDGMSAILKPNWRNSRDRHARLGPETDQGAPRARADVTKLFCVGKLNPNGVGAGFGVGRQAFLDLRRAVRCSARRSARSKRGPGSVRASTAALMRSTIKVFGRTATSSACENELIPLAVFETDGRGAGTLEDRTARTIACVSFAAVPPSTINGTSLASAICDSP